MRLASKMLIEMPRHSLTKDCAEAFLYFKL